MILATAQCNSFPDTIKKAAFEDIIGNYFAFDPFLQPGRKGRVIEYYSEPDKQSSVGNFKEDPVPYSIPPIYPDSEDFDENPPVYISNNPSKFSDSNAFINDHSDANNAFNYKQFKHFHDEEYPQYSEFPNKKEAAHTFIKDSSIIPNNPPEYVLGINEESESIFPSYDELNIRGPVYRGQLQHSTRSFNSIGKQSRIFHRQAARTPVPISRYSYYEEPDMY